MSRLPSTYNEKMLREIANDAITPKKAIQKFKMTYMNVPKTVIFTKDWTMTMI